MNYKVKYKEIHYFWEYVEAESEEEAIAKVKEEKEMRLAFEVGDLMDWGDAQPLPIKIEEDPESYRAVYSTIGKACRATEASHEALRRINRKDKYWKKK